MKVRKRLPKMRVESPHDNVGVGGGALPVASDATTAATAATAATATTATTAAISAAGDGGGGDDGDGQLVRLGFHLNEGQVEYAALAAATTAASTSDSDSPPSFALLTGPVISPSPTEVVVEQRWRRRRRRKAMRASPTPTRFRLIFFNLCQKYALIGTY